MRETTDFNFLSKGVRITGFVLVGLSLSIILISALWVRVRRAERIVTASQPQFLYLICFGGALQAVSLIFLSFDESYGWTDSELDKACSALPWFFVIGYLVQYCAIFSKVSIGNQSSTLLLIAHSDISSAYVRCCSFGV